MPTKPPTFRKLLTQDSEVLKYIKVLKSSMIAASVAPTWENFLSTRHARELTRDLDRTERNKFRAWWTLTDKVKRDEQDSASVTYAICVLVMERRRVAYAATDQAIQVHLAQSRARLGIPWNHAVIIEAEARSRFKAICG